MNHLRNIITKNLNVIQLFMKTEKHLPVAQYSIKNLKYKVLRDNIALILQLLQFL